MFNRDITGLFNAVIFFLFLPGNDPNAKAKAQEKQFASPAQ